MSNTALAINEEKVPAHILQSEAYISGIGRGNEEVGINQEIPRIKQLQKMSNEVDKHHNDYKEGAEPGDFFNSLDATVYKDELFVISLKFKTEFVVWRDRDVGGGLGGAFNTAEEAFAFMAAQEKPAEWGSYVKNKRQGELAPNEHSRIPDETHSHVLLIKNPETGLLSRTPVIMDFSRSKLRVSRNWNTQITGRGGDRFAAIWRLSPVSTMSSGGEQFLNLNVECAGWATKEDYEAAGKLYEDYSSY